jgi:hypothetical protein
MIAAGCDAWRLIGLRCDNSTGYPGLRERDNGKYGAETTVDGMRA